MRSGSTLTLSNRCPKGFGLNRAGAGNRIVMQLVRFCDARNHHTRGGEPHASHVDTLGEGGGGRGCSAGVLASSATSIL